MYNITIDNYRQNRQVVDIKHHIGRPSRIFITINYILQQWLQKRNASKLILNSGKMFGYLFFLNTFATSFKNEEKGEAEAEKLKE